jgi:Flp pilus assembly protein TadG
MNSAYRVPAPFPEEMVIGRHKEKGQTMVLFVMAIVTLLVFIGLALDGGMIYATRRKMQNSADSGAMAGARALLLTNNNAQVYTFTHQYSVTRKDATSVAPKYYPGNQEVQNNSGSAPGGAVGVCVKSETSYRTLFMSLIGVNNVPVSAEACASATSRCPGPGYAIWAHARFNNPNCMRVIDWSGSTTNVTGNVHSNGNINVGGSDNRVVGRVENVSGYYSGGGNNRLTPTVVPYAPDWPVEINLADYQDELWNYSCIPDPCLIRPRGRAAELADVEGKYYVKNGSYTFQASDPDGLYYVKGDFYFSISSVTKRITVVAEGSIDISGSNHNLSPYIDGILFYSNALRSGGADKVCNEAVIKMAGSTHSWAGIIYAPRGMIEMSGSSNTTVSGSIIGQSVRLNGSSLNINYSDQFCPIPARALQTRLLKP